jgi:hypothetical protein
MNILNLFKKPEPILMRCTLCSFELPFSMREVRRLEKLNAKDPVCPIKEECHICHTGFMIPVSYINKSGKTFLYDKIKPKIKNLDPDTVAQRIYEHPDMLDLDSFS